MNLSVLESLELSEGAHDRWEKGACLMEAVAYVAGETFSDHPECACPLLSAYGRSLNDNMPTDLRQELKPLIPMLVGSRSAESEERRSVLLADWYIREHLPRILVLAKLEAEAEKLAALPPLTRENTQAAIDAVKAAGSAAWAARAAWDARDARAAWAARDAWDTWDAWDAWDARAAWAATFDLTAKARAEQQGVELNADTIQGIMAPVIAELWRSQIDVFRRAIEAGPHGDARV